MTDIIAFSNFHEVVVVAVAICPFGGWRRSWVGWMGGSMGGPMLGDFSYASKFCLLCKTNGKGEVKFSQPARENEKTRARLCRLFPAVSRNTHQVSYLTLLIHSFLRVE